MIRGVVCFLIGMLLMVALLTFMPDRQLVVYDAKHATLGITEEPVLDPFGAKAATADEIHSFIVTHRGQAVWLPVPCPHWLWPHWRRDNGEWVQSYECGGDEVTR